MNDGACETCGKNCGVFMNDGACETCGKYFNTYCSDAYHLLSNDVNALVAAQKAVEFWQKKAVELSDELHLHLSRLDPDKMRSFHLSVEQYKNAVIFIQNHECKYRGKYTGAIGGTNTFSFTDTSIGQICNIKCACGDSQDISDL